MLVIASDPKHKTKADKMSQSPEDIDPTFFIRTGFSFVL